MKNNDTWKLLIATVFVAVLFIGALSWQNRTLTQDLKDANAEIKKTQDEYNSYKSNIKSMLSENNKRLLDQNGEVADQSFTTESNSDAKTDIYTKIKQSCQEDQAKYNSCLIEYNAKMIEYQSCQTCKQNGGFGCAMSCSVPYNSCNQYQPSSLC